MPPIAYTITVEYTGGPIGGPQHRCTFSRQDSTVAFRCFLNAGQVGVGGHGLASAARIEALLGDVRVVDGTESDLGIIDGRSVKLTVAYGQAGMFFNWYCTCPPEWPAVQGIYDLLCDWARPYWESEINGKRGPVVRKATRIESQDS